MPVRPIKETLGGWQSFGTFGSGAGAAATSLSTISGAGDFQLQSGPGRLDSVLTMPGTERSGGGVLASGQPVVFYDAANPTSGGPYQASGHKIVAITATSQAFGPPPNALSGFPITGGPANPQVFSMPFQSGLTVALRSGQPPFTVFWSTEPPSNF